MTKNIKELLADLAELKALETELNAELEAVTDQIKSYMTENDQTELLADDGSKVTYSTVVSKRFDTSKFRKESQVNELIYQQYLKQSTCKRFQFHSK